MNNSQSERLSMSINLIFKNKCDEKLNPLSLAYNMIKGRSQIPHVPAPCASVCLSVTPVLLPASHFAMDPSDLLTLKMCLFPSFAIKVTARIKRGGLKTSQPPVSHRAVRQIKTTDIQGSRITQCP